MERRRRSRVVIRRSATVAWSDGGCRGEIFDLSLKGCLVECPGGSGLEAGRPVTLTIPLDPGASELDVRLQGRVIRREGSGVAVDFTEIPEESFLPLFHLVQYNSPDPGGIQEELASPAFGISPGQSG